MRALEAKAWTSRAFPTFPRRTPRRMCRFAVPNRRRTEDWPTACTRDVAPTHVRRSAERAKSDTEGWFEMATLLVLVLSPPAMAASEAQSEFVTNTAGLAFTLGVAFLLFRLLRKRGKDAVQNKVRSSETSTSVQEPPVDEEYVLPDPLQTLFGGLQAGGIALAMWYLTSNVDAFLSGRPLPSGYTARNIAVTIKTIALGLCYLGTFVFGANSVGLFGLTLQVLFQPDKVMEEELESRKETQKRMKKRKELEALDRELKAAESLLQRAGRSDKDKSVVSSSKKAATEVPTRSTGGKGFLNLSRSASMDDLTLDLDLKKEEDAVEDGDK